MNKSYVRCTVVALALGGVSSIAHAGIVYTPIYNPANGHYYAQITAFNALHPDGMTWDQAKNVASGLAFTDGHGQTFTGHLATITSAAETNWVVANLYEAVTNRYFLGGYQSAGATSPADNWTWITGEAWSYTNWEPTQPEPNDGGDQIENGEESILTLWIARFDPTDQYPLGVWNDQPTNHIEFGFVVEFEPTIPSPGALSLLGLGGLVAMRRRR
ncbi:MAG: hypothetical protein IPK69_08950 [Phycisphaerales bacterium]|nr:MAG: hypothetical protein IPK69_08950 [Phycisphaerales bacterium]